MIIFLIRCVYEKLNRVKNISLYNLSTDFNTRVKEYNIKIKYNNLRLCDLRSMFILKFQHYFLLIYVVYNIIILNNVN